MDPLSALRLPAGAELRSAGGAGGLGSPGGLGGLEGLMKSIPAAELEKLAAAPPGLSSGALGAPEVGLSQADRGAIAGTESGGGAFDRTLNDFVSGVNARQAAAGQAVQGLLSGQNVSLHQTMISMEEANVSFQLMVEVRNRLLESYQELMRMQV